MHSLRLACLILMLASAPALAAEPLPGVEPPKPLVQPLPEPAQAPQVNDDGSITIGNTRVKVSGSITVDIGVGTAPKPR